MGISDDISDFSPGTVLRHGYADILVRHLLAGRGDTFGQCGGRFGERHRAAELNGLALVLRLRLGITKLLQHQDRLCVFQHFYFGNNANSRGDIPICGNSH